MKRDDEALRLFRALGEIEGAWGDEAWEGKARLSGAPRANAGRLLTRRAAALIAAAAAALTVIVSPASPFFRRTLDAAVGEAPAHGDPQQQFRRGSGQRRRRPAVALI